MELEDHFLCKEWDPSGTVIMKRNGFYYHLFDDSKKQRICNHDLNFSEFITHWLSIKNDHKIDNKRLCPICSSQYNFPIINFDIYYPTSGEELSICARFKAKYTAHVHQLIIFDTLKDWGHDYLRVQKTEEVLLRTLPSSTKANQFFLRLKSILEESVKYNINWPTKWKSNTYILEASRLISGIVFNDLPNSQISLTAKPVDYPEYEIVHVSEKAIEQSIDCYLSQLSKETEYDKKKIETFQNLMKDQNFVKAIVPGDKIYRIQAPSKYIGVLILSYSWASSYKKIQDYEERYARWKKSRDEKRISLVKLIEISEVIMPLIAIPTTVVIIKLILSIKDIVTQIYNLMTFTAKQVYDTFLEKEEKEEMLEEDYIFRQFKPPYIFILLIYMGSDIYDLITIKGKMITIQDMLNIMKRAKEKMEDQKNNIYSESNVLLNSFFGVFILLSTLIQGINEELTIFTMPIGYYGILDWFSVALHNLTMHPIFQSHIKDDIQHWHCMAPAYSIKTNLQVQNRIIDTSSEWYQMAITNLDLFPLGHIIHCIQDSFAEGHTGRKKANENLQINENKMSIVMFQSWLIQNQDIHEKKDNIFTIFFERKVEEMVGKPRKRKETYNHVGYLYDRLKYVLTRLLNIYMESIQKHLKTFEENDENLRNINKNNIIGTEVLRFQKFLKEDVFPIDKEDQDQISGKCIKEFCKPME